MAIKTIIKTAKAKWKALSLTDYAFENYDILKYRLSESSDYYYVLVSDILKYVRIYEMEKGPFIWKVSFNVLKKQGKLFFTLEDAEIAFLNNVPKVLFQKEKNQEIQEKLDECVNLKINVPKLVDQTTFKGVISSLHLKHKGCFKSNKVANNEYLIVKIREVE